MDRVKKMRKPRPRQTMVGRYASLSMGLFLNMNDTNLLVFVSGITRSLSSFSSMVYKSELDYKYDNNYIIA